MSNCRILASTRQKTSSPKYKDDISLLILNDSAKKTTAPISARLSMTIHRLAHSAILMTKGITIPSTGTIISRLETSALPLIR
jgi:hypothetical protein